mgnify:FL=1
MLIFLVILVFDPLALLLTLSGTIAILSIRTSNTNDIIGTTRDNIHTGVPPEVTHDDLSPNKLKRWKSLNNTSNNTSDNDNITENRRGV